MSTSLGYWTIEALCRVDGEPANYLIETRSGVVARDLDEAIAAFRGAHSHSHIWSVKRLGDVHIIAARLLEEE